MNDTDSDENKPALVARCPSCCIVEEVWSVHRFDPKTWHADEGDPSCCEPVRVYSDRVEPSTGPLNKGLEFTED